MSVRTDLFKPLFSHLFSSLTPFFFGDFRLLITVMYRQAKMSPELWKRLILVFWWFDQKLALVWQSAAAAGWCLTAVKLVLAAAFYLLLLIPLLLHRSHPPSHPLPPTAPTFLWLTRAASLLLPDSPLPPTSHCKILSKSPSSHQRPFRWMFIKNWKAKSHRVIHKRFHFQSCSVLLKTRMVL